MPVLNRFYKLEFNILNMDKKNKFNLVKLGEFNEKYWDSLPEDKKEIYYEPEKGKYHTLLIDKKIAGVAGIFISDKCKENGFFQIYIDRKFRGKGLLKKAADLICQKYNLKELIASIKKSNKASTSSHLKYGFKKIDEKKQQILRDRGLLKKDEIRLKYYPHT